MDRRVLNIPFFSENKIYASNTKKITGKHNFQYISEIPWFSKTPTDTWEPYWAKQFPWGNHFYGILMKASKSVDILAFLGYRLYRKTGDIIHRTFVLRGCPYMRYDWGAITNDRTIKNGCSHTFIRYQKYQLKVDIQQAWMRSSEV